MKALSLWQPWATLLARGVKRVETRSWPCPGPFPRVLAVHASKHWDRELDCLCRATPFREALAALGHARGPGRTPGRPACWGLPAGAVVGLVRVLGYFLTEEARPRIALAGEHCVEGAGVVLHALPELDGYRWPALLTDLEVRLGDYSPGRWGWVCDEGTALDTPVPAVGRQGLFEWAEAAGVAGLAAELLSRPCKLRGD